MHDGDDDDDTDDDLNSQRKKLTLKKAATINRSWICKMTLINN